MADIRDPVEFIKGRWDWRRCGYEHELPRGIGIGDIDGFMELRGKHLFIESKHWHGDGDIPSLPRGQQRALRSLCKKDGQYVIVLWGCPDHNRPFYAEWWEGIFGREFFDYRLMDERQAQFELRTLLHRFVSLAETPGAS